MTLKIGLLGSKRNFTGNPVLYNAWLMSHTWNVTPKEAIEIQKQLREEVRIEPLKKKIHTIAGCDVSMNLYSNTIYAGFIVLSYPDLKIIDQAVVKDVTHFPYVPGLLSFREIPALLKAWKKLETKPDLVMVDGQGIAHPRRLGIASHLGLALNIPTIGCAKSVLYGKYNKTRNVIEELTDPKTREVIGAVFQSKPNCNPLIISVGHKITLVEAILIVQTCLRGYRLPEPTRLAHHMVNDYRKR
jgi:deoxyribonuclease V